MSLSTFSFRKKFFLILFWSLMLFGLACLIVEIVVWHYTSAVRYISTAVSSKAEHLRLNYQNKPLDIIFIGSSRSLYQIDTDYFVRRGFSSYNFGLESHMISSYQEMVQQALRYKPKFIVISVDIPELYSPLIDNPDVYLADIIAYKQTRQPPAYIKKAWGFYFDSFNPVRKYSAFMYEKVLNAIVPRIRKHQGLQSEEGILGQCVPFEKLSTENLVIRCQDGDGIIFGHENVPPTEQITLTKLDPNTIIFVEYLMQEIKAAGVTPLIVLTPSLTKNYHYDLGNVQSDLGVKVFDFTDYPLPKKYWANEFHLNGEGRELYSNALARDFSLYLRGNIDASR